MKAIQFTEYGTTEVLKYIDMPKPEVKPGYVRVQVKAAGVNFAEIMKRYGTYLSPTPLPCVPGAEVAGIIEETSPEVTAFSKGDRVVALTEDGGYAEYISLHESQLIRIPENVDYVHAASILLQGLTAYHTLKTSGQLAEGETVLVHAAAGGVGSFAVQLARLFGAGKIIATASTDEKLEMAKSLGADVLINYTENNWQEQVMEHTGGKGADVILEMVGGDVFKKSLKSLGNFGRLVIYGKAGMAETSMDPTILMQRNTSVIGFWLVRIMQRPELYRRSVEELLNYISSGKLKVNVGETFKLEDAAEAHATLEGRQSTGKIVLIP
ncbi:quinone oxidoreductase family protein [Bacillus sp. 1P06AnD]|uniref:quinone oxidoreductase family protein n=1 Tax=Bacillus sp. 1P06AnD TaxID=3132208 RepID=UPI0039A3DA6F